MKRQLHSLYLLLGHLFCRCCLLFWNYRDIVFPPKERAVLFIAHPDDDTLFFHTFIKEHKPYVVLCTAGWSLRRLPCFFKAMKRYGVKYRAYDLHTRDQRLDKLAKIVKETMSIGHFELCATHNKSGEYGHEMHRRVHDAVVQQAKTPVFVPVNQERIINYPLPPEVVSEKENIFRKIYVTETWVLEQQALWVKHEKLEKVRK